PADGAGAPSESVPLPSAVQLTSVPSAGAEKVHVKSALAPGARVVLAGLNEGHDPPATTLTLVSVSSPVFVSVTTTVIVSPAWTFVGADFVASEVDGLIT